MKTPLSVTMGKALGRGRDLSGGLFHLGYNFTAENYKDAAADDREVLEEIPNV